MRSRNRASSPPSKPHHGFSLVELLVVMTILSMLAVISIPSLGLVSSTALTSAGNQMMDIAARARENSISRNAWTAIVIKKQGAGAYSAYCMVELTRQDDGSFGTWETVTAWRYLPQGIVFSPASVSANLGDFLTTSSSPPQSLPLQYPFQSSQIDLNGACFQIYQPDGTLNAGQSVHLRLSEGTASPSGSISYTHKNSQGTPANYYDIVFLRDTGQTKAEKL